MTSRSGPEPASPASEPVVRNPYRVLGLPGESTWQEIRAAADRILDEPEPERHTTAWDLPWLGEVPRSTAEVERAVTRLSDPRGRLRSRVFWFHERVAETAVYELHPATIRNALEGWSSTSLEIARHDAAVVALIAAIALDPAVENSAIWQRALREWGEALDLEAYWMDVLRVEMEGGFEDPASLAEVRDLRDQASELVTEPLLVYAREAVIAEQNPRAGRTLAVLREVLSPEAFESRCGDLAEHVWGSFDADWSPRPSPPDAGVEPAEASSSPQTQNPAMWDMTTAAPTKEEPAPARSEASDPTEEPRAPREASDPTEEPRAPREASDPTEKILAPREAQPEDVPAEPPTPRHREVADARSVAPIPARDEPAETRPEPPAETGPVAPEPDERREPDPAPAPVRERRPAPPARPIRRRVHPAIAAGAVAAALLALVFLPRFRPETEAGATPTGTLLMADVERRMETIDGALAEALVDRHRRTEEIDLLRESLEGYQTLVDDYERRIARRLPADLGAYRRVTGLRDQARGELDAALDDRAAVDLRIERLSEMGGALIDEWNAVATESAGNDRAPSPR